jgi:hypothetical protein
MEAGAPSAYVRGREPGCGEVEPPIPRPAWWKGLSKRRAAVGDDRTGRPSRPARSWSEADGREPGRPAPPPPLGRRCRREARLRRQSRGLRFPQPRSEAGLYLGALRDGPKRCPHGRGRKRPPRGSTGRPEAVSPQPRSEAGLHLGALRDDPKRCPRSRGRKRASTSGLYGTTRSGVPAAAVGSGHLGALRDDPKQCPRSRGGKRATWEPLRNHPKRSRAALLDRQGPPRAERPKEAGAASSLLSTAKDHRARAAHPPRLQCARRRQGRIDLPLRLWYTICQ